MQLIFSCVYVIFVIHFKHIHDTVECSRDVSLVVRAVESIENQTFTFKILHTPTYTFLGGQVVRYSINFLDASLNTILMQSDFTIASVLSQSYLSYYHNQIYSSIIL